MRRIWDLCLGEGLSLAIASGSSVGVLARVVERIGLHGQAVLNLPESFTVIGQGWLAGIQ
ncbi:MAG TPA: hypothetical protein VFG53_18880 [Anaeromyxobacter sp.]|nr:hypothetical protein [Anaeromyxobacter sp.]